MRADRWLIALCSLPALLLGKHALADAAALALGALILLGLCGLAAQPLGKRLAPTALILCILMLFCTLLGLFELALQLISIERFEPLRQSLPLLALPCLAMLSVNCKTPWFGIMTGLAIALSALFLGLMRTLLGQISISSSVDWQGLADHPSIILISLGLLLALARLLSKKYKPTP